MEQFSCPNEYLVSIVSQSKTATNHAHKDLHKCFWEVPLNEDNALVDDGKATEVKEEALENSRVIISKAASLRTIIGIQEEKC